MVGAFSADCAQAESKSHSQEKHTSAELYYIYFAVLCGAQIPGAEMKYNNRCCCGDEEAALRLSPREL